MEIKIEHLDWGFLVTEPDGKRVALGTGEELISEVETVFNIIRPASAPPVGEQKTVPSDKAFLAAVLPKRDEPLPPHSIAARGVSAGKVLALAKEQIDIYGKVIPTKISEELKLKGPTISYHLDKLHKEIQEYLEQHYENKYKPVLRVDTSTRYDGNKVEGNGEVAI